MRRNPLASIIAARLAALASYRNGAQPVTMARVTWDGPSVNRATRRRADKLATVAAKARG